MPTAPAADAPVSLRRIGRLFAPHRARLAFVVALIVVSSVIGLAQPFLVKRVIDEAIPQQDVALLVAWCSPWSASRSPPP